MGKSHDRIDPGYIPPRTRKQLLLELMIPEKLYTVTELCELFHFRKERKFDRKTIAKDLFSLAKNQDIRAEQLGTHSTWVFVK